jgi:hypothetical protein
MIITPNHLKSVITVCEKLEINYKVFYVSTKKEAEEKQDNQLPPPNTVYIYVVTTDTNADYIIPWQ